VQRKELDVITIDLNELVLMDGGTAGGAIRVTFPFHRGTGTASTAAVLFELDPGQALATHTDSAEEVLLVLEGEGEAHVGQERGLVRAGQIAIVPAMAPHGVRNIGDTTLRILGFFSSSTVVSYFDEWIGPEGENVAVIGGTEAAPLFARVEEPSTLAV
jgi:quercetin dioxygenase-like cupin family protein